MKRVSSTIFKVILSIAAIITLLAAFALGVWASLFLKDLTKIENVSLIDETPVAAETPDTGVVYSSGFQNIDFYDNAYKRAGAVDQVEADSAIVAHHLIVADEIAKVFSMIGSEKVKTVVLLSPNHFSQGLSAAQISKGTWQTPYGDLTTDDLIIEKLAGAVDGLEVEETGFQNEHGIAAITPFIKRSFPNAKLVPIVIHESVDSNVTQQISAAITSQLPNAVVIASLDMSHYLPQSASDYHDSVTGLVLESGQADFNLEIDSNAVMKIFLRVNEILGNQVWQQTYHDNSLSMIDSGDPEDNTSHILGYFSDGEPGGENFASIHFIGDIMLDRGTRVQMDKAGSVSYPWEKVTRFLDGSHLTIGNLEGTVNEQKSTYTYNPPFRFVFSPASVLELMKYVDVVSLANNHVMDVGSAGAKETRDRLTQMGLPWFGGYFEPTPRYDTTINDQEITIIGWHQFQSKEADLLDEIEKADQDSRFVIVMPHWGNEYQMSPSSGQKRLAKEMVDAGADLIVGGHPHVPQGMEMIGDVPVVYSLGNFVFDQQIPATWQALTIGLILEEDSITLHLMPISTQNSQPAPLPDSAGKSLLEKIAAASPEALQDQIINGIIKTSYDK